MLRAQPVCVIVADVMTANAIAAVKIIALVLNVVIIKADASLY
jgi:hypothetical protein